MSIDDKIEKALDALAEETRFDVSSEVLSAAINAIPLAGGPIAFFLGGGAKRAFVERAVDVFAAVKERLESVEETKIDAKYFETEEFQTLLTLVLEQLRSTHDKQKLRMLAQALANSALNEFATEARKELFIRIVRDLSPNHIQVLKRLKPDSNQLALLRRLHPSAAVSLRGTGRGSPMLTEPRGEELGMLQSLAAHGLVEEFLTSNPTGRSPRYSNRMTPHEVEKLLGDALAAPPVRNFALSLFGMEFLNFVGGEDPSKNRATPPPEG